LASIGADLLSQSAAELEHALAQPDHPARAEMDLRIDAFDLQLNELLVALRAKLPAAPAVSAPPDAATCLEAVEELDMLLAVSNPDALAWLERNPGVLRSILPAAQVAAIETAVRAFDLDDALLLLRAALAEKDKP
jgi:hypothetical protein